MSKLKTYTIELKLLAPLYIGSGKKIGKKEYIVDKTSRVVKLLNMQKMTQLIFSRRLFDRYQQFMCGNEKDIYYWFRNNAVTDSEISSIVDYTVSYNTLSKNENPYEINTFMKDAYSQPYIPGSSLKGALRTILLAYRLNKNKSLLEEAQRSLMYPMEVKKNNAHLSAETKRTEASVFNTLDRENTRRNDAVNDIMQGLIVGDSMPISRDKLMICQRHDMSMNGNVKTMPTIYECLKPDTVVTLPLTINTTVCDISVEEIKEAITCFYSNFLSVYESCFTNSEKRVPKQNNVILLGGNVGFLSKTINYNILNKPRALKVTQTALNKVFYNTDSRKMKNRNDDKLGLSPHVLHVARFNNQLLHMGECAVNIS